MAVTVKTEEEIKNSYLGNIPDNLSKIQGTFTHDHASATSLEVHQAYLLMEQNFKNSFVQTADEEYLVLKGEEYGVFRNEATSATGDVILTGTVGTIIPVGTLFKTDAGTQFSSTIQITLIAGNNSVHAEAVEPGINGNVPSGTIKSLVTTISGVATVNNPNPFTGGTDIEDIEEYRGRVLYKMQKPATSGNKYHYQIWARDIDGVGDAKVFPVWDGGGTVKICIIDSNMQPATVDLVNEVQKYLLEQCPVGAGPTTISAAGLNINVSVDVALGSGYTLGAITPLISEGIFEYLKEKAFTGQYNTPPANDIISYAQIGNVILNVEGVIDYQNLIINGGVANVEVGAEQVAILGALAVV